MQVVEFGPLEHSARRQLEGDERDPFDARGTTLQWRPKDRHVGLRDADGWLIASAGLVLSELSVNGGAPIPVVGIGGVIVAARHRGQGLSTRLLAEALRRAAALGPDLALLFCHRNRAGLYERHAFVEIPPPVMVEQPSGFEVMPQVAMWRALHQGVSLPAGRVKLLSHPF